MTIRPVYERPRVLRTLLCLLVGVLALLWRAVPSFPWNPPSCPSQDPHYHTPCPGDGFIWLCCALGPNYLPGDDVSEQYWCTSEARWKLMQRYSETYFYETWMRLRTLGGPGCPHCNAVCHKFGTTISCLSHVHARSGYYFFEPGCWNTVTAWHGSSMAFGYRLC